MTTQPASGLRTSGPREPRIDHTAIITTAMTENDLDRIVRAFARWLGLRVYSVRNSKLGVVTSAGYPDLTLVGSGGIIFRELKRQAGKPTPDQVAWGQAITAAGGNWRIWRPADLKDRAIETELRLIAHGR